MQKVKNWSPVWIFPIVTALIGAWILFYHYSHQGPEVTLITTNAEGIEGENPDQEPQRRRWGGGERDVDRRSHPRGNQSPPQFRDAEAAAQRFRLLGGKAAGWPRGISGLGTLLSGAYIELQPGTKGSVPAQYPLLDSPPLASPDAKDPYSAGKQQGGPAVAGRSGVVPRLSRGVSGNQHLRYAETSYNLPAVHQCAERSPR